MFNFIGELWRKVFPKKPPARRRMVLRLSPEAVERLEQVRREDGSPDRAEVVRRSLRFYEWYLQQIAQEGWTLRLAKDGEPVREVEIKF